MTQDITEVLNNLAKGKMPLLVIMVGVPGSGKSSFVEALKRSIPMLAVAHMDRVTNGQKSKLASSWKACREAAIRALIMRQPVCIDRTNCTLEAREEWLHMAPKGYRVVAVVLDTSLEDCIRRAAARTERPVPAKVIKELHKQYVSPTREEGFTDIFNLEND
jgi:predicted kinase